jgi:chemotaxis protein CheX
MSKIDTDFIAPFVDATRKTLETQANTPTTFGTPLIKSEQNTPPSDIAGVISLVSTKFTGTIAICFPEPVFLKIYENMVYEKVEKIGKEQEDAAGELLNIIFGVAKAELNNKKGFDIQKAIPTIVRGGQIKVRHMTKNVAIILPFESAAGSFHVEISSDFE